MCYCLRRSQNSFKRCAKHELPNLVMPFLLWIAPPESIWPVTVAGWVTLVASLGTLVLLPYTYGKWIQKMNGLGGRVSTVEESTGLQKAFQDEESKRRSMAEAEAKRLGERVAKVEAANETVMKDINEHHAEQRALLEESSRRHTTALHEVALQVREVGTKLNERGDMTECFDRLGTILERSLATRKETR